MPDYQHRFEELNAELQEPASGDGDVLLVTSFVGTRVSARLSTGREFGAGEHIVNADVTLTDAAGHTAATAERLFPTASSGSAFARVLYAMALPSLAENASEVSRRYGGMPAMRLGEHVQDAYENPELGFPLTFRVELFGHDYTATLTRPDGLPPHHAELTITDESGEIDDDLVEHAFAFNGPPDGLSPESVEQDVFDGVCSALFDGDAARPVLRRGFADTITDSDGDVVLEPPSEGVSDSVVVVD